jgi:uncharacterized protein (TIGR02271 family)
MSQTVIGLFDTPSSAEKVRQQLIAEGYSPQSIRVLSNESEGFAEGAVSNARTTGTTGTGIVASVKNFFQSLATPDTSEEEFYTRGVSGGGALVAATVEDQQVEAVASLLEVSGARQVSESASGATGRTAEASSSAAAAGGVSNAGTAIPIVEEEMHVGKRQVARGGVRVYSHVTERPVEEQVRLREEHVRVQRNPVNRPVSSSDIEAFSEGTIELTETAEEAVVAKQARVVEEVTIGKEVTERTETVRDKVRRTEVDVEEIPGETVAKTRSPNKL